MDTRGRPMLTVAALKARRARGKRGRLVLNTHAERQYVPSSEALRPRPSNVTISLGES